MSGLRQAFACSGKHAESRVALEGRLSGIDMTLYAVRRKALGGLIFGNAENKRQLEAIVWPAIRQLAAERIKQCKEKGDVSYSSETTELLRSLDSSTVSHPVPVPYRGSIWVLMCHLICEHMIFI